MTFIFCFSVCQFKSCHKNENCVCFFQFSIVNAESFVVVFRYLCKFIQKKTFYTSCRKYNVKISEWNGEKCQKHKSTIYYTYYHILALCILLFFFSHNFKWKVVAYTTSIWIEMLIYVGSSHSLSFYLHFH